jgi:ribonucleoside-diphosphate reductase alpha chain
VIEIKQPIVGYSVVSEEAKKPEVMLVERPEELPGTTYKLKTPLSDAALYISINNLDGKPFEIFINSKDMRHYQWTVALTRVISAVFRHGGESAFLVEELQAIQDPSGGYFKKGRYVPSLVAEIGGVLEKHLTDLGLYQKDTSLADAAAVMLAEKGIGSSEGKRGSLCPKCGSYSMIRSEGCDVCLECSYSHCGG